MKDITTGEKRMTLKEIADATGAAYSTIAEYAQRAGWTKNGKKTLLDEAQVTLILEAMRNPVSSGAKSNLLNEIEGKETSQSLDFQLALIERKAHELWKRKALEQESRAINAEAAFGREVMAHRETRIGLEAYQRIAESAGLVLTDRDDLLATYRRR